jgi:hypothetical protein
MWLLDPVLRLWSRLLTSRQPDLIVDEVGFTLREVDRIIDSCRWDEMNQITAFKRDHGMYDEIYLQFDCTGRTTPVLVSEEYRGYEQLVTA